MLIDQDDHCNFPDKQFNSYFIDRQYFVQISSEEVVRAYVDRCLDVNPIINAIVESRFDTAIQEACKIDKYLAQTTKTDEELARQLPLLGVPITVKESIAVKGSSPFLSNFFLD